MNIEQRRTAFLQEMGFRVQWLSKQPVSVVPELASPATPAPDIPAPVSLALPTIEPSTVPSTVLSTAQPASDVANMNWNELNAAVAACTACGLGRQRRQTVFGRGNPAARWLVIGDTPDQQDEAEGMPFAGQAGTLLNNMLRAVGHSLDDSPGSTGLASSANPPSCYSTNLVKCRAQDEAGNPRPPGMEEINACRPFLQRQIQLMQPRLILAVGKTAAQALRLFRAPADAAASAESSAASSAESSAASFAEASTASSADPSASPLRGVVHRAFELPMVATWHPSILLRQPAEKRQVWADLCLAKNHDESGV